MFNVSKRVFWLALFAIGAWAQVPTAKLTGTVTDPSGAVVSGAKIVITNTATNVELPDSSVRSDNVVLVVS